MLRASLKNLLSRKIRLVMSSIAIVLGVGFVVGSLIFGDMLKACLLYTSPSPRD